MPSASNAAEDGSSASGSATPEGIAADAPQSRLVQRDRTHEPYSCWLPVCAMRPIPTVEISEKRQETGMRTYEFSTSTGATSTWRDKKRYLWVLGLVVPLLQPAAIGLHAATGLSAVLWLGPVVLLVLVPLIDLVAGYDDTNP